MRTSDERKTRQASVSKIVGENLRRVRVLAGMSQETLGDKLGITFQQIQKYEKGANRVSAPVLVELTEIFGVDIKDFFGGCLHSEAAERSSPIPNVTPRTLELAEALTAMSDTKAGEGLFRLVEAIREECGSQEKAPPASYWRDYV